MVAVEYILELFQYILISIIFSNCLDLSFPYGTLFSRYSSKKLQPVISKRLLIPLLISNDILANQEQLVNELKLTSIGRIETFPFGFDF